MYCRKIESISATWYCRRVHEGISKVESDWAEKERKHPTPYTLSLGFNYLKARWSSVSIRLHTTPSCEYFRPVPTLESLCLLTYVRLWGGRFRRHNDSSKQQQSQPNTFAVAVVVATLGRSLHFRSFPDAS